MDLRSCWTLFFLLVATAENPVGQMMIQPCPATLKPTQLTRRAVVTPEQLPRVSNDSRNLMHQIVRGPCLQLEHSGQDVGSDSPVNIYGTCDYERMFRYTSVHVGEYNCWQSRMAIWEPGSCEVDNGLVDDYQMATWGRYIWEESSSLHFDTDEGLRSMDYLGRECMCNSSRDMVAFWREKCPHGRQISNGWKLQARIVVKLMVMLLGMYLLGWVVVHLARPWHFVTPR